MTIFNFDSVKCNATDRRFFVENIKEMMQCIVGKSANHCLFIVVCFFSTNDMDMNLQ